MKLDRDVPGVSGEIAIGRENLQAVPDRDGADEQVRPGTLQATHINLKTAVASPQRTQRGTAAAEAKPALTQRRRGRGETQRSRTFSFFLLCDPQRISASLR